MQQRTDERTSLSEVAKVFFRLGCTAFGGPAAHIAMMEDEVVKKRKWISSEHFLDLVGATNLIPGPNSTEMTMHCGHERAGWKGLVVGGICFILPAVVITGVIAWTYQEFGTLPDVQRFIYGIKPAIIAVIISTMISLGRKALKSVTLGILGVLAAILTLIGVNEIYVLFGGGVIGILIYYLRDRETLRSIIPGVLVSAAAQDISSWKIFLTFLKIGSILYGSGYVLFAFLDAELVSRGLLSKQELIDAIAVGQFTPGPVFSSATFIGWQIGGIYGAIAATIGIFLPAFIFVAFSNPIIPKLRKSPVMSAFLDAVNIVSLAIILAVVVEMGRETLVNWRMIVIAILSLGVTIYFRRINTALIVIGGAALGYILSMV
ncbi:chromate efflux transporter [Chryseosolibacter indicus]|uniref:Chromate efflux transporter n=1 Tax=Chryseosolibacter indicus TaxID=2782351 RepID=A0ABS5VXU9_9BACT|nr:chromate efflux transporter [Chryseosolibacter indicus]MBT1705893.1 chromate efflux transporter [Chryseosolibacter indicus]